jgi:hypothetical protein
MPLIKGTTKASREKNIKKEIEAGKDPKQAVAIAYATQRKAVAKKAHSKGKDKGMDSIRQLIGDLCKMDADLKRIPK